MTRVLGIDPGSRKTGFGVIDVAGSHLHYVASGVIRLPTEESLPPRLQLLFRSLTELIEDLRPDEVAIEQVFMAKSADAALKLGQARGAAIVAAVNQNLPVHEYEARKVKQAVVGTGAADKHQVKHMVMALLGLQKAPAEDASDALAVAICHINSRNSLLLAAAGAGRRFSRGRNRSA